MDDPFDPINVDIKQTKKRSSSTAEKKQNDNIERIPIVNIDSKDGVIVTDKNGEDEKKKSVSRVKTFQDKQKKLVEQRLKIQNEKVKNKDKTANLTDGFTSDSPSSDAIITSRSMISELSSEIKEEEELEMDQEHCSLSNSKKMKKKKKQKKI